MRTRADARVAQGPAIAFTTDPLRVGAGWARALLTALHAGEVADVAGDNAAYDRVAMQREANLLRTCFWEVEFHRRFAAAGDRLEMVPDAVATLAGPVPTGPPARQRFAHGREFGIARVRDHRESAVRILISAPLAPMALLARMSRRAA